jgi:hypothetical protein
MCAVSIMKKYYLYFGNMSRICGNFTVEKCVFLPLPRVSNRSEETY